LRFIQQHLPLVAVLTLALLWFQSAFVVVGPSDVVILERFGQAVNLPQPLGPGWHLKFPWPIDRQVVVPVAEVQEITVGYTKELDDPYILWRIPHHETEYQLVTGDGSLVSVNMFIRYKIKRENVQDWYLTAQSPRAVLEAQAYRLLGQNIRSRSIFWVIGPNRQELAQMIKNQIQELLDRQRLGLQVLQVNLLNAHPPTSLNPDENIAISYLKVFDSLQTRQKDLNNAGLQAIQEINEKNAEAAEIITDAEAQGWQTVSRAAGRTRRFRLMIELLQNNPDYLPLVRSKLYLNYLREALGQETGKIVIDPRAVDSNVEIWLQYPRKPIPFIEEPPLLTPSDIGAKSTREK
jgi:membrane protease subunit HflK